MTPPEPAVRTRPGRGLRLALGIVVVVVAVVVVGGIVVRHRIADRIHTEITRTVAEGTGRDVRIDAVHVGWTGRIACTGIEAGGDGMFGDLTIDRVEVRARILSLFSDAPEIAELLVIGVDARLPDGVIRGLERDVEGIGDAAAAATGDGNRAIRLARLVLRDVSIELLDDQGRTKGSGAIDEYVVDGRGPDGVARPAGEVLRDALNEVLDTVRAFRPGR